MVQVSYSMKLREADSVATHTHPDMPHHSALCGWAEYATVPMRQLSPNKSSSVCPTRLEGASPYCRQIQLRSRLDARCHMRSLHTISTGNFKQESLQLIPKVKGQITKLPQLVQAQNEPRHLGIVAAATMNTVKWTTQHRWYILPIGHVAAESYSEAAC